MVVVPNHIGRRQGVVPIQPQEVVGVSKNLNRVLCPGEVPILESERVLIEAQPPR